jgi:hypothetical protein
MNTGRPTGRKSVEWVRRYLPCEIAGTVGELGGVAIAYLLTGSVVAAAIVATVGSSVGYYATAYGAAVRAAYGQCGHRRRVWQVVAANGLALRSIAVEFGPAEAIDSLAIRPVAFYLGPQLFDNMLTGWIVGKVVADVGFYVLAICSYERFKGGLVLRNSTSREVDDGHPATV